MTLSVYRRDDQIAISNKLFDITHEQGQIPWVDQVGHGHQKYLP